MNAALLVMDCYAFDITGTKATEKEKVIIFFYKKSKTKVLQSQGVSLWLGPTPYIHYA